MHTKGYKILLYPNTCNFRLCFVSVVSILLYNINMIKLTQYNFDICKQLYGAPVILHSVIIGWYIPVHVWASLMTEIILLTLLMQPFGRFWMMSSIIGCKQFGHVSQVSEDWPLSRIPNKL